MKVKLEHKGWHRAPPNIEHMLPHGYHKYLAIAANGIMIFICQPAENDVVEDGSYDMPDSFWSYDNPLWDELAEKDEDHIWDID